MPDNKTLAADVGAARLEDDKAAYQNPTMTITPVVEQEYSGKERYDIDPFEAQREARGGDYVELRTMGWIQAGLVSTAEVCNVTAHLKRTCADEWERALLWDSFLSHPSSLALVW